MRSEILCEKIIKVLDEYGIDYKERDNSLTLQCPICTKYKLDIHKYYGYYICYHCADSENVKGKNAAYVISQIAQVSYSEVRNKIESLDLDDLEDKPVKKKESPVDIYKIEFPSDFYRINLDIAKPGAEYLASRGVDLETAKKLELRYWSYRKQVVFPIFHKNILVGYQGRCIDPNVPKKFSKYTMPGFKKANYLMFEKTIQGKEVILAEGPISALKFAKSGLPFVASMGKYVSTNQIELLQKLEINKIYLALDRDAHVEVEKLIRMYNHLFQFYFVEIPLHRDDFGDCTFDECTQAVKNSYFATVNNILPSL